MKQVTCTGLGGIVWLSWSFLQHLYHHIQSLHNHTAKSYQVLHAACETWKVDVGCFAISSLSPPLPSLLPNVLYLNNCRAAPCCSDPTRWSADHRSGWPSAYSMGSCGVWEKPWQLGIFHLRDHVSPGPCRKWHLPAATCAWCDTASPRWGGPGSSCFLSPAGFCKVKQSWAPSYDDIGLTHLSHQCPAEHKNHRSKLQ